MDSDQGKLFIGGISWETNEDQLTEYFQSYGDVLQTIVMRDKLTGKPRGFGFVVFSDPNVLDRVLQDTHAIDGRTVETKRALSRDEQQVSNPRSFGSGGNTRTKKIFVGGLPPTINEDGFRQYFETYGAVTDVVIMYDQQTSRPRGFGFISFDSEDAVDRVLHKTFHDLNGKQVEVKRAMPKDAILGGGGGRSGYQENLGSYDSRTEQNRYGGQGAGGGYPLYGSSGYNASGYGYGAGNNAMGYGYGGYGNPNAPNDGYGGNAGRGGMGYQAPTRYDYGSSQWGGGNGGALTGQLPTTGSGYGNQGYSYGGYGGGSEGAYGAVGGPRGDSSGSAPGGGYNDGSGSGVYGNLGWRTDPSQATGNYPLQSSGPHGGQVGHGGGSARAQQ